jgi:hypothetical protein
MPQHLIAAEMHPTQGKCNEKTDIGNVAKIYINRAGSLANQYKTFIKGIKQQNYKTKCYKQHTTHAMCFSSFCSPKKRQF